MALQLRMLPLHAACSDGVVEDVRRLIEQSVSNNTLRCDIDAVDMDGFTPLHVACHCNHAEIVKLLLDNGADVNAHNSVCDEFPLNWACEYSNMEIVKILLDNHANVEMYNKASRRRFHGCERNRQNSFTEWR